MKSPKSWMILIISGLFFLSCAGGYQQTPFKTLVEEANSRAGESVTLGGYILNIQETGDQTVITVLQTPLGLRDRPQSENRSQGSFVVLYPGKLNPDDAGRKRKVTVTGKIAGTSQEKIGNCPDPCLKIESRKFRVWPQYEKQFWGHPTDGP